MLSNGRKISEAVIEILVITLSILTCLVIISIVFLNKNDFDKSQSSNNVNYETRNIVFPKDGKVKIYRSEKNQAEEIELEQYITGVVASEMPANFHTEAIKAQAVAARTFYMNRRKNMCSLALRNNAEICDTVDCQVYLNKEERMLTWSKNKGDEYWAKIEKAVMDTKGEVLIYDNELIEYPQYFSTSHGKTEEAVDVLAMDIPYLKSVDSQGEEIAPKYKTLVNIDVDTFINKIHNQYDKVKITKENIRNQIYVKNYTKSGSVNEINIGNIIIKGTEFRKLFNLNSSYFTLNLGDDIVSIVCTGYGHGLGMSQWGANCMAKKGSSYEDILKHYYTGIEITKLKYE